MAVKGARTLRVHRSEAETLDGHRNGGYARERVREALCASILSFHHVDAAATLVTPAGTVHAPFCSELLHSTHVDARKHVNASVCAVARCMALMAFTFPQSYRKVTLQQPAGGDVSCLPPMRSMALFCQRSEDADGSHRNTSGRPGGMACDG
jgi:hypothetical protein